MRARAPGVILDIVVRFMKSSTDSPEENRADEDLEVLEGELEAFDPGLLQRERIVVGSKLDAALPERQEVLRKAAERRGLDYFEISSATHEGLKPLVDELRQRLRRLDAVEAS